MSWLLYVVIAFKKKKKKKKKNIENDKSVSLLELWCYFYITLVFVHDSAKHVQLMSFVSPGC